MKNINGLKSSIKTKPIYIEKIWGGRSLKRLFNKNLPKKKDIGESWELYSKNIPIVVKLLDIKKPLSVQVHPKGKSELWYILESGKKSSAMSGMHLKKTKIRKGDLIYVPSGTVHTIFPPAVLLEVSQDKLITYRLFDWGRKRGALDIKKGLAVINPKSKLIIRSNIKSFKCKYFRFKVIDYKKGKVRNKIMNINFVLNGRVKISNNIYRKGETLVIPRNDIINVLDPTKLIQISY